MELAQSNDELIDALVPNAYKAAQLKKAWHDRTRTEIEARVAKEVEATMTLTGMRQQAKGVDVNDLLASSDDNGAVERLAGFMTQKQIETMQALLQKVGQRIEERPDDATAQRGAELDDDMDAILAGGSAKSAAALENGEDEDEEEPRAKRHKRSSETTAADEEL